MNTRLTECANCQQLQPCTLYRGLWLCRGVHGACYPLRRVIYALMQQGRCRRALGVRIKIGGSS